MARGEKKGQVNAALVHDAQLIGFKGCPDFRVTHWRWIAQYLARALELGHLLFSEVGHLWRCGGEMAVDIDDHVAVAPFKSRNLF